MDFERSTQSRSWMFDERSLQRCRAKVIDGRSTARKPDGTVRVRKFASGYHRCHYGVQATCDPLHEPLPLSSIDPCELFEPLWAQSSLTSNEQDILVRFHAHQITMLIGPQAILPSLVRSPTVLATAITFFRRFFLSNSILDFTPRRMAVAAAFLAAKVEDQKVEIDILEHATDLIQQEVKGAPLCRHELSFVTVEEIEIAEIDLMEGLNYEMRCHHPYNAVRILAAEVSRFLNLNNDISESRFDLEGRQPHEEMSPIRRNFNIVREDCEQEIEEVALIIAQNSLIFSDVPFLFPPGQIAFAAVAMSMDQGQDDGLPLTLRTYLRDRFISKSEDELLVFERQVSSIVDKLRDSPIMDMKMIEMSRNAMVCDRVVAEQAEELRRVFQKVSNIRSSPRSVNIISIRESGRSKRKVPVTSTLPSPDGRLHRKLVKVTPTKM